MHRTQTGKGVTSDEIQANVFFTVQRNSRKSITLIRYKTKYVTKQSGWWLQLRLKPTYIFLARMINFRDNRTVPLIRRYISTGIPQTSLVRIYSRHLRSNTERQHSNFVSCYDIHTSQIAKGIENNMSHSLYDIK